MKKHFDTSNQRVLFQFGFAFEWLSFFLPEKLRLIATFWDLNFGALKKEDSAKWVRHNISTFDKSNFYFFIYSNIRYKPGKQRSFRYFSSE